MLVALQAGQTKRVVHMSEEDVHSIGPFRLFKGARLLTRNGSPVRLPAGGAELLLALIDTPDASLAQVPLLRAVQALQPDARLADLATVAAAINQVLSAGGAPHRVVQFAGGDYALVGEVASTCASTSDEEAAPGRLPLLPDVLFGRDESVRTGLDQLARQRLLTITGGGGVGKTTLAVAMAQALTSAFADGVRFVDLAPLTHSASLASAVFTSLGYESRDGSALHGGSVDDMLAHVLADREILIVLDNCEHVIDRAAMVAEQLLQAGRVKVLATSREPLRCRGEAVLVLGPMEVPPPDTCPNVEQAGRYGSVQLFLDRVVWNERAHTGLSEDELLAVFGVCRRLDGIPLALELAAAHVGSMGLRQLLDCLEDSAIVALSSASDALQRHQTLVAALDWSHALLSDAEQTTLRRLSVFRGDFAVDSALRLLADAHGDETPFLDALIGLQTKSMLSARVVNGAVYYRLLETTRDYAQARLMADPLHAEIRRRHALDCKARLEGAQADWVHMNASRWRVLYGLLISDVRSAIDWTFSGAGDPQLGAELLICSTPLATRLELFDEYVVLLRRAIEHLKGLGMLYPKQELQLFVALRSLTPNARDTSGDFGSHERLLALAEALQEDDSNTLAAWVSLWLDAMNRADYPQAASSARWHLAWALKYGDDIDVADAKRALAYAQHFLGDQQHALALVREVLGHLPVTNRAHYFNAAQVDLRVSMRIILARAQWLQGRYRRGMDTAMQAVQLAQEDSPRAVCLALSFAACPIALWNGDRARAELLTGQLKGIAERIKPSPHERWADWFGVLLSQDDLRGPGSAPTCMGSPNDMEADLLITMGCSWLLPQTLPRVERQTVAWCAPEVARMQGVVAQAGGQVDEARRCYDVAITLARRWGLTAWSLRACTSLARLELEAGKPQEALAVLRPYCAPNTDVDFNADELAARQVFAQAMAMAWR